MNHGARSRAESRNLCVVLLSGLGDVVHGLPLVNSLRDHDPALRITWVVEPTSAPLLEHHRSIDTVIVFRRKRLRGLRKLWSDLRAAGPFDLTINMNVYLKSVWPTVFSRAPRRIGFNRSRAFEGVWLAANEHLPDRPWAHTADMFLEFLDRLEIPRGEAEWRIEFTQEEKRERQGFRERHSSPIATIIPASASYKKDWLPERWAEVADALTADFGFDVVIAGGPGYREQRIGRQIVESASSRVEWAMGDSVRRLAVILSASSLVLAPDTGPVHLARAFNVPVIGLYGHTNPWRVGPWRAFEDLWVDHYTERGTEPDPSNRTPRWEAMPTIATGEVLEKVSVAAAKYEVLR